MLYYYVHIWHWCQNSENREHQIYLWNVLVCRGKNQQWVSKLNRKSNICLFCGFEVFSHFPSRQPTYKKLIIVFTVFWVSHWTRRTLIWGTPRFGFKRKGLPSWLTNICIVRVLSRNNPSIKSWVFYTKGKFRRLLWRKRHPRLLKSHTQAGTMCRRMTRWSVTFETFALG